MSQTHILLLAHLPMDFKATIEDLSLGNDPLLLLSQLHHLMKTSSHQFASANNTQEIAKLLKSHILSPSSTLEQNNKDQHLFGSDKLIQNKCGLVYSIACELIAKVFIINIIAINIPQFLTDRRLIAKQLSTLLSKFRFQFQIQNMSKDVGIQKIVDFQDLIAQLIKNIFASNLQLLTLSIFQQAMKSQISNVPQQIIKSLDHKIYNKNSNISILKDVQEIKYNSNSDLVLKHIKLRQNQSKETYKQIKEENKQIQKTKGFDKKKYIFKQRTIYHQRKNIYISKKKKEMHANIMKYDYSDHRTQWSLSKSRSRRIMQEIDDELEESFLAFQTPKPQKIFFDPPISMRINFQD